MKKALALFLAVLLAVMSVPAFALDLETAKAAVEIVETPAEASLSANWFRPGLNVVNEQAAYETFTGLTELPATVGTNGFSTRELITDDSGNSYMRVSRTRTTADSYPQVVLPARLENGRKYYLNLTVFSESDTYYDLCLWAIGATGGTNGNGVFGTFSGSWQRKNQYVKEDGTLGDIRPIGEREWYAIDQTVTYNKSDLENLYMQFKIGKLSEGAEPEEVAFYVDDIAFIPYYKITYVDGSGAVIKDEQVLFEEGHDNDLDAIVTSYTPDTSILPEDFTKNGVRYEVIGWTNANGGEEAMDEIPLTNTDVVLYPAVRASDVTYFSTVQPAYSAAEGTTFFLTAAEELGLGLTVDVGDTEATYEINGDTIDFIAAGKPGVITVTNLFSDGAEISYEIALVNGGLWKPGLNTITGTTEPFGFENHTEGTYGEGVIEVPSAAGERWIVSANPIPTGNTSAKVIRAPKQFAYTHIPTGDFYSPAIEADRPVRFSCYRLSNVGGYIMINQGGLQWGDLGSTNGTWVKQTYNVSGNPYTNRTNVQNRVADINWIGIGGATGAGGVYSADGSTKYFYLDDISFIPYYKITYMNADGTEEIAVRYDLPEGDTYAVDFSLAPEGSNGFALEQNGDMVTEVPLANEDITLYAVKNEKTFFVGGGESVSAVVSGVIPTPEEVGLSLEHFIFWIAADGTFYRPGDIIIDEELVGAILTAYCQDASMPAMGLTYEGDTPVSAHKSTVSNVFEAGRSVLRVVMNGGQTYDGDKKRYMSDARVNFRTDTAIDASEYTIFTYVYKPIAGRSVDAVYGTTGSALPPEEINEETMTSERENGNNIIYYWTSNASNGFYYDGEHRVGGNGKNWEYAFDGEWHSIEVDMSDPANGITAVPWNATGLNYGITVDPLQWVNWSGETLIDSVRIYRGGHLSVTYLCDGEIIAIDGNRGAGVGYVLRDDIPLEKEGYTFAGWSLTENGPVTKTIDLADDTTVYAVFTDKTIDFGEGGGKAFVTVGEEAGDNVNLIAALYDASGRLLAAKTVENVPQGTYAVTCGDYAAKTVKLFAFGDYGLFTPLAESAAAKVG